MLPCNPLQNLQIKKFLGTASDFLHVDQRREGTHGNVNGFVQRKPNGLPKLPRKVERSLRLMS